jgi:branched-chain amino acid transport system substrate-binding protein
MRYPTGASRRVTRRQERRLASLLSALVLLTVVSGCGEKTDDEGDGGGGGNGGNGSQDGGSASDDLLGPEDAAEGEPVKIGLVSDGATQAFDNTDELRAGQATAEFYNTHRGGIGGRPVELVTCEAKAEPATATDCANQFVEEGVVAVGLGQSAVAESIWEPLHAAGIPTMFFLASGEQIATDDQTSSIIANPLSTFYGLPLSVAEDEGTDRIAFVVIDVPVALTTFESLGPQILDNAGLEWDLVTIPVGTADMTSQMREVADSGAGVVHVLGNDAFCIAAFQGLEAVGFEGEITTVAQCVTDATREAVPGEQLEGISLTANVALGAEDDETFQLYQAVMDAFGDDVEDVNNPITMSAYTAVGALVTAMADVEGDITPESVNEAIKAMPESELPGGGGVMYQCGGSALATQPAVCTNQWLRTSLDGEGQPAGYEVVDSSAILEGL